MPKEISEEKKGELSRIALEAQSAQQQGANIQNQIASLQSSIIEIRATMETLKNIREVRGGDVLLPIGAGVFVNAKIAGGDRALVEIGGNIITEKSAAEATEILEKRLKVVEETRERLQSALAELDQRLRELDAEAKRILAKSE
ncbi:MAG: prefoldin subunit alpha [Candidatus Micrarchaeia archaeon]